MNILVVNDSKLIQHILGEALSTLATSVAFSSTSKDALAKAQQTHFDFIAVSCSLADGSGIDLIHRLRVLDGYHHSPIVLLTAEASPELHIKALRAGATDIFLKQNLEELVNFISRLLSHEAHFEAHLLYVEDSPSQAKPMIQLLQSHGLKVDWFTAAEDALLAMQQKSYDLVLTDIVLNSTMQGTMFAMHIRRLSGDMGDIPILALTAYDKVDSRIALFQIGIDDYVSKPVIEEELLPRIYRLVDRQRLLRALKQQEEQSERYSQAKSTFLAHMSHEIRTPISGIVGAAELLEKTELDAKQRQLVTMLKESSKATLVILNDVLDLSKIEAGKLDIEQIPMNLRDTVEGTVRLVLTAAEGKHIEVMLFVSPLLPLEIVSDPTRLSQMLLNLLSNAIKFTGNESDKTGVIQVRVEPVVLNQRPGLQLCVIDNGIGINEEAQKKLFQPFAQAEDSTYRHYGGTGLGLNIVKTLVEIMGGRINVKSVLGQGTEFCLELPLQESATAVTPVDNALKNVRVAILSRHAECAAVLVDYAQSSGAEAIAHSSFEEIRLRMQQGHTTAPQVVVLDLEPGDKVNLDIAEPIGIVELLTGLEKKVFNRSVAVSTRPLFYRSYIEAISASCGLGNDTESASDKVVKQPVSSAHRILLAEDNELNQELFRVQFELMGMELVIANNGQEALDLWRQQDFAMILTDCEMPNMDGFELTRRIRGEEPSASHTIIVAVTANALKGEDAHCLAQGMDDYIVKPVSLDDLSGLFAKWLGK